MKITEVVAALIWDKDKFMICQRPAHKARSLLWEFVGGKVEAGETKEQALVRECKEELGVTLSIGDVFMDVVHEYPDITVHLTLFNTTIAEGEPQKLEHNDIRWITPSEIPNYEFCPADEAILKKIESFNMNRPYIICHMVTSIDCKVTGDFLFQPECAGATDIYYRLNREMKADGFICGRVTMEGSFTGGWYPDLSKYEPVRHGIGKKMDCIVDDLSGFYAIAFDTHGKLGWKSNKIIDPDGDPGYDGAQIIEVLSEDVDERYLGYLESMEIPYIFAGETSIDVELALFKLKNIIGCNTLLLEGGSIINGAFERADVVDELSLVVAPTVACKDSKPLFMDADIANYELVKAENENGNLVLNYKRK